MANAATTAGRCYHMITPLFKSQLEYPPIKQEPIFLFKHSNCRYRNFSLVSAATSSSPSQKGKTQRESHTLQTRKASKSARRLITISTPSGRFPGKWTCDYEFSLKDLQLEDLVESGYGRRDSQISVTLTLHKHTGFGLSIDGSIVASFPRTCSNCSSPYCSKIDTSFNVWVLPSSRDDSSTDQLPEIGGDDPSVIYVKPGDDAELDSLIQETVRLQLSVNQTCSEACEKSEPKLYYIGEPKTASLDRRWSRLLELRNKAT